MELSNTLKILSFSSYFLSNKLLNLFIRVKDNSSKVSKTAHFPYIITSNKKPNYHSITCWSISEEDFSFPIKSAHVIVLFLFYILYFGFYIILIQ